jgi:hypothetical protein
MKIKREMGVVIMVIIMAYQLFGDVRADGELLIPTAEGKIKPYKGIITITQAEILIECKEKIFQLFNEDNAPKQAKIRIDTEEVERISLQGNKVIIFPKDLLYNRYRNLLNHVWLLSMMKQREMLVFIFVIDIDTIGDDEFKLLGLINERNDPHCNTCGYIRLY